MEIILLFNSNSSLAKKQRHCLFLLSFTEILILIMNRPLHGFCRHLGCGTVAAKITVNVWDIVQISTPITPQLYIGF